MRTRHLRWAALLLLLAVVMLPDSKAEAVFHLVEIDEVMAGANGDANIQFVEMRMCCFGQNTQVNNAQLLFFDAEGVQTGVFLFTGDTPPGGNNVSFLTATQAFADLPETPAPDFIMPAGLLHPDSGKVCYKNVPSPPAGDFVNLCLSYGSFTGSTEGAGSPAPALPITGATSLERFQNCGGFCGGQSNADFQLESPAPKNGAGVTGTVNAGTPLTLSSISVTPMLTALTAASTSTAVNLTQQFAATGTFTDASTQDITATVTWSSVATPTVATIDSGGLATTVAVGTTIITAIKDGVTSTPAVLLVTVTSAATTDTPLLVGSLVLEGDSRPDASFQVDVVVAFYTTDTVPLVDEPVHVRHATASRATQLSPMVEISLDSVLTGTYHIAVRSEHTLITVAKNVTITISGAFVNFLNLLEGDADANEVVDLLDFAIMSAAFGTCSGDGGFDVRADFDRDGCVGVPDLGLLSLNFGQESPKEVT